MGSGPGLKLLAVVLLVAGAFAVRNFVNLRGAEDIAALIARTAENRSLEALIFVALYGLAAVLVLPSFFFTLAGGFLFGTWQGTLLNLCGATMGAAGCFLIARRFGLRLLPRSVGDSTRFLFLTRAVGSKGVRGVLYLRLTPLVPFSALNYGFGLTQVTLLQFVSGTFLGLLPKVLIGTALGAAGATAWRSGVL